MSGKSLSLLVGLVLMCFSASLYFTSDMGVSTYDFVALYISKIQKKVLFQLQLFYLLDLLILLLQVLSQNQDEHPDS